DFSLLDLLGIPLEIRVVEVGAGFNAADDDPFSCLVSRGAVSVVGFEPAQSECDRLNALHAPRHRFLPYYIGDGTRRTFHVTNQPTTCSLYEPNTPLLEKFQNLAELVTPVSTEMVQTHRLDDLLDLI